jgi:hypothetical protein
VQPQQQDDSRKAAAEKEWSVSVPAGDAVQVTAAVIGSIAALPAATTAGVVVGTGEAGKGLAAAEHSASAASAETGQRQAVTPQKQSRPQQQDVSRKAAAEKEGSVSVPAGDAVQVATAVNGSVATPAAATTEAVVVWTAEAGKSMAAAEHSAAAAEPRPAAAEPQQMDVDRGNAMQKDGAAQSAGVEGGKREEDSSMQDGHEAKRQRVE